MFGRSIGELCKVERLNLHMRKVLYIYFLRLRALGTLTSYQVSQFNLST